MIRQRHWLEWAGLVLGTLFAAFLLFMFIAHLIPVGDDFSFGGFETVDIIGFCLLAVAIAGAVLAWFRLKLGAWLQIGGSTLFLTILSIDRGRFLFGMLFNLFIVSGALILVSGLLKWKDERNPS